MYYCEPEICLVVIIEWWNRVTGHPRSLPMVEPDSDSFLRYYISVIYQPNYAPVLASVRPYPRDVCGIAGMYDVPLRPYLYTTACYIRYHLAICRWPFIMWVADVDFSVSPTPFWLITPVVYVSMNRWVLCLLNGQYTCVLDRCHCHYIKLTLFIFYMMVYFSSHFSHIYICLICHLNNNTV